jgi:uncharacterized protein YecA (UPF0149 family)
MSTSALTVNDHLYSRSPLSSWGLTSKNTAEEEILRTWCFPFVIGIELRTNAWYEAENTRQANKKAIEFQWLRIKLVEMRGIEPLTSALRTLRSPN